MSRFGLCSGAPVKIPANSDLEGRTRVCDPVAAGGSGPARRFSTRWWACRGLQFGRCPGRDAKGLAVRACSSSQAVTRSATTAATPPAGEAGAASRVWRIRGLLRWLGCVLRLRWHGYLRTSVLLGGCVGPRRHEHVRAAAPECCPGTALRARPQCGGLAVWILSTFRFWAVLARAGCWGRIGVCSPRLIASR